MSDTSIIQIHPGGVRPYADTAASYLAAGWTCVIPVPAEAKFPPPPGYTGAPGRDTTPEDVAHWSAELPGHSIALRMPDGVIGIDVDQYAKGDVAKNGAQTIAEHEARWGPLPPTYSSTARGPGQPSRILLYRVPAGRYAGQLMRDGHGGDVEIIQRHHRYAVVAPSPHAGAGAQYRWYAPDGSPLELRIPAPHELAELPAAWVQGLAEGAGADAFSLSGRNEGLELLRRIAEASAEPCIDMARQAARWLGELTGAEHGSRHDAMTDGTWNVINLAAEGHSGGMGVLQELQQAWEQATAGEGRDGEFAEAVETGARKAVTKLGGTEPVSRDPCILLANAAYQAPAPGAPAPVPGSVSPAAQPPVEPERQWSPFGEIGTHPFDPQADMDALLAREVLGRTWPVLRYAPDAGAWLVRGPENWEASSGDLAKWGVDLVSWLMLPGDPGAPDGSPDLAQAKRRARFQTNGGANGIAGKMNAQVAAGHHPSATRLSGVDGDREILWAGGLPYDLRASEQGPAMSASVDPGTVHLHSAGVTPDLRPAPLWDAFTVAVWPDPELRAWAIRVLSVAFTGYADKALPVLVGETDRGKTQLIMLLMSVLGSYAHVADARLLAPADRSHASIVYALKGRRLSFIDEAPRKGDLAAERLKQITGGADLTGNRMHENPITFSPTHTLILTANPGHEPDLNDPAVRSRTRLIPCDGDQAQVRFTRAAIGALNGPAWRAEAPGVLAFMMGEAARWLNDQNSAGNAKAPGAGQRAVEAIIAGQDLILAYVREECEAFEHGTRSRELYMAFTESCRRMAIHPSAIPTETKFGRRLTELGYPAISRKDGNYRPLRNRPPGSVFGLALIPDPAQGAAASSAGPAGGGSTVHQEAENATLHEPSTEIVSPGQTIHLSTTGGGLEGTQPVINTHTGTHTHTCAIPDTPTLQPSIPSTQEPEAAPDGNGQLPLGLPPESPSVTKAPKPKAGEAAAARAAAKAAEKATRLRELEGPVHQLPVLVARNPADPGAPPLVLPCSPEDARQACGQYLDGLCVDVEHTGYSPGRQEYALRLVQMGGEHLAAVLDPDDPAQCEVIRDVLARARWLHAHSAIADLIPLALAGLADSDSLWDRMVDSVLIAKLADPALSGSDESQLKKLSTDLLGAYAVSADAEVAKNELFKAGGWLIETKAQTPLAKSGWAQVAKNCETFLRYAGADVLDLAAVIRVLPRPEGA